MLNGLRSSFIHITIALFVISCSHVNTQSEAHDQLHLNTRLETTPDAENNQIKQVSVEHNLPGLDISSPSKSPSHQKLVNFGDGKFISNTTNTSDDKNNLMSEGKLTLNFQETDLHAFIKVILSDILQENFIIDPKVSGVVSIETSKPFSKDELFPLLENILSSNNAGIIKIDGLYKILPKENIAKGNLTPLTAMSSTNKGYASRIIPLKFISADEMKVLLAPFAVDEKSIQTNKQRNLLILNGTGQELNNFQEIIEIFDVDWLKGMSFGLYPLNHVSPKVLTTELESVIRGFQGNDQELLGGLVRIVPIERLNSILLISPTHSALSEAEHWLYQLDQPGEDYGKKLFIYNVQNAKAVELAEILNNIFQDTESKYKKTEVSIAPGLKPVDISSVEINSVETNSTSTEIETSSVTSPPVSSPNSTATPARDGLSITVNKEIEIIADDVRNALVILASPRDYKMIEAAIKKLDKVPLQVLIEASIIEVTLNNSLRYGVEWFFKNGVAGKKGEATLDLEDSGITNIVPGFSYSIIDSASDVRFALNALESQTNIDVISTPSIMVLDNQQAKINVGDQIPIPTRQSISNIDPTAPTVNEIEFRDTGVSLVVKPRVNESGLVMMEVSQDVSDAQTTTSSGLDAPTIRQRQIESTVAVHSKETIVLGGLIRKSKNNLEDGVPYLSRLPVIGKIFGRTSNSENRTELLVLLTPTVIRNRQDTIAITGEFRKKMTRLKQSELDQAISK